MHTTEAGFKKLANREQKIAVQRMLWCISTVEILTFLVQYCGSSEICYWGLFYHETVLHGPV